MGLFGPPDVAKLEAKRDVDGLIKALGYQKNADIRRAAAAALGKIGDASAVRPLIAALNDSDNDARQAAGEALVAIGPPAVEPLVSALEDWRADADMHIAAAWTLGQTGDSRAVEPLVAALHDRDKDVRQAAAEALVEIGQPAVEPLVAALHDRDKDVRRAAAEAMQKLAVPVDDGTLAWYAVALENWTWAVHLGAAAVEPLISALQDSDEGVRQAAAEALGQIGDARAVEPLVAALKDSDEGVRQAAAEGLGQIGDARAVEPLIAALGDSNRDMRRAAAGALGQIGDARAVEPLVAALKESESYLRRAAAEGLGKIGDARAVEPLVAALKDSDEDVRQAAATVLAMLYRSGKVPEVERQLILSQRGIMAEPHVDSRGCWSHVDSGIGIEI